MQNQDIRNIECSKQVLQITDNQRKLYFEKFDAQSKRAYPCCVCYYVQSKKIVTLNQVDYDVQIHSSLAIVNINQFYENTLDYPAEIEYLFSINPNAAFTELKVTLGDKTLYGIIKEKEIAQREYEDGIQDGKTMLYSEILTDYPDVMRVKLGNLEPRNKLEVKFQYVMQLQVCVNEFWRLEIDPVVHPRYMLDDNQIFITNLKKNVDFQHYRPSHQQNIAIQIESVSPITFCKSPTHKILIANSGERMVIELDKSDVSNFEPDKTFLLLFADADIHKPQVYLSHTNNDALQHQRYCATLTFIPKFNPLQLDDAYRALVYDSDMSSNHFQFEQNGTYIFLLDRSGSMYGIRIQKAKEALILFIKSLPQKCLFNVISFGSEYKLMFSEPQPYSQLLVIQAIEQIQSMTADMGGTELLYPLNEGCFSQFKQSDLYNIFILTDGDVTPDPILELVRSHIKPNIRVYTLGIGDGCSKYLIEKLAYVGNGSFHFVTDNEDLNLKVIDLLEDSLTPYLQNIQYQTSIKDIYSITPNPASILSIKKNKPVVIQVLFPEQHNKYIDIEFQAIDPQTNDVLGYKITILLADSKLIDHFHKIAAYRQIQIIETEIKYKEPSLAGIYINKHKVTFEDIIQISLTNQVISSSTAFICEIKNQSDCSKQQQKIREYQKYISYSDMILERQSSMLNCYITGNTLHSMIYLPENAQYQLHSSSRLRWGCLRSICSLIASCFKAVVKKCRSTEQATDTNMQSLLNPPKLDVITQNSIEDNQADIKSQNTIIPPQSNNEKKTVPYQIILNYIQIDGSVDSELHNVLPIKLPRDSIDQKFWIVIITLCYLELYCQNDKDAWQLLYRKGVDFLTNNGIKYTDYKAEAITLINDIN